MDSECSSVHTSDLSNFEESSSHNFSEEEEDLEEQLLLIQNEEGMGYIEGIAVIALVKMFVFCCWEGGGGRGPGGTATVDTE